ncbi:I78 family peptidase inhibitor [Sphingobium sp. CR2-8]|uniref:I78 family peptidase inhibitor n=1 Tax=Sphingobium sp. CR2-8 TaxID=1306534 RepID=UPI002DC03FB9|nr:I78 family peptidase inhibitor [Sphingobium sp. CR2-8]MEC3909886.1 I78 family peptidase inhibitor [Sphingobium sp. CR2-8]
MRMGIVGLMVLGLTACAGANGSGPTSPPAVADGPCKNEGLDRFHGQKADAQIGVDLLKASGAKTLRWGGPGMAMTMDFRPDRLTVSYDAAMVILSARCG